MVRRNLVLLPTVERRGGKVHLVHRWMRPEGSLDDAQRALNALAVRRGVPGWLLSTRNLPRKLAALGERHPLWHVLGRTPIVIGGSHPHYNHRSNRIYVPARPPIWVRIVDGVPTMEAWVRRHIPYAVGVEGEVVVLHEALHALDYTLGGGRSLWATQVKWRPSRRLARVVHPRWEYAYLDPREVPTLAVEMALYAPDRYEVMRRLALEEGFDLEGAMRKYYKIDLRKIKGPYDEEAVMEEVERVRGRR